MPDLFTDNLYINILLFLLGLYTLTKSSDKFVDASVFIAEHFHISEIVIGLTLVSIGTSLPELATNIYSSLTGSAGIATGNAIGSNITNILLALGLILLVRSFPVSRTIYNRDGLMMGAVFIAFAIFAYTGGGQLQRWHGITLLTWCVIYIWYLVKHVESAPPVPTEAEITEADGIFPIKGMPTAIIWIIITIGMISFGAKIMVDNIVWAARKFEISESIISATIIAIGTSLPEVAVSFAGVKKAKPDIVIGNIVGSCIFNLLLVMGVTAAIKPLEIDSETSCFLIPYMLLAGFLSIIFMRLKWCLYRWHGIILSLLYLTFLTINIIKIVNHD